MLSRRYLQKNEIDRQRGWGRTENIREERERKRERERERERERGERGGKEIQNREFN